MPLEVLIGLVFLVILLGLWLYGYSVRRLVLRRMRTRRARTPEEFGIDLFSPDVAPVATRLRKILARHVVVDLSRLGPDDRFIEDLQMVELDSLSTVNLVIDVEQEFGIEIPDADAASIHTFRELADYVSQAVRKKATGL